MYILPTGQFKPPVQQEPPLRNDWVGEISIPSETHNIQIRPRDPRIPDFFYVVVYTSGSLDPFLLPGI